MWIFNTSSSLWSLDMSSSVLPVPRIWHAMYVRLGKIIVFGGASYNDYLRDMWSYNPSVSGQRWTQLTYSGLPPTMSKFANTYDAASDVTYMWGGEYGAGMVSYSAATTLWKFNWYGECPRLTARVLQRSFMSQRG